MLTYQPWLLSLITVAGIIYSGLTPLVLISSKAYAYSEKPSVFAPTFSSSSLNSTNGDTDPRLTPTEDNLISRAWVGWSEVPGRRKTNVSPSATTFNGRLYLINKELGTNRVYKNVFNGSSWEGWSEVPGNGITDLPLASISYEGRLYIFRKGLGG
ncbi:hypothetical protein DO97_09640 [Neosynechococcus sphagnicola sy1]|uniref:Uncharacterized protein n=1 Tax=Neosynechococcus sphagnicola sy1 TaxID=1497020 RepID=A0A098TIE3_9CYAN|nr:hypothetical protein [Neosynechococcus sphagnicola]KGF72345.1 hypothetical protein DO97_09640 [Neosynechococcus sphagnicola sy1]